MKKCPYCGRSNEDDVKVCLYCYAAIPHEEERNVSSEDTEPKKERASKKK